MAVGPPGEGGQVGLLARQQAPEEAGGGQAQGLQVPLHHLELLNIRRALGADRGAQLGQDVAQLDGPKPWWGALVVRDRP